MNKDLASSAKRAAEIYVLLETVADNFGNAYKPTATNDENGYAFGIDLKGNSAQGFEFLKERQKPDDRFIWFGYEPDAGREVSVWVCALLDRGHKELVLQSVSKRIQEVDAKIDDGNKDESALILIRAGKRLGDREWFENILGMLKTLE